MNETVLTQEDWLVVANNLSVWINDSVFLDITADFTKSGTSIFVLRFNDANYASALTLGMTVSLAEAIALANEFLKEEKNWPRGPATSGPATDDHHNSRKEVSSVAYHWKWIRNGVRCSTRATSPRTPARTPWPAGTSWSRSCTNPTGTPSNPRVRTRAGPAGQGVGGRRR